MIVKNSTLSKTAISLTAAIGLVGCGGGGGSSGNPPIASSAPAISSSSSLSSLISSSSSSISSLALSSSSSSSKKANVVTITGIVTDNTIPNATVTIYVGSQTFIATSDATGKYSVDITVDDANLNKPIKATAKGSAIQSDVEFVSLLPSFKTLMEQAGSDATLNSIENFAVNITNVTTAEYALIEQNKFSVATDTELETAKKNISETEKLTLAALIKIVVDEDDYNLPNGVNTTLELALNKATTTSFLAAVNAKDAAIIESTISSIKNDVTLIPVSPLIGSWYLSDTTKPYPQQSHMLITFVDATHYIAVMDVEEGSFNCKDGAEYGTYTWNAATGELKASSIVDNNGECGVDAPVAGTWTLANANTELVAQENDGNKTTLAKVVDGAGIKGSWAMQRGSDIYVFTILDETHYMGSWPTDSEHDVEYGTYTYNAGTGKFVGNTINYISPESQTTLLIKNNQLERTSGNEKDIWQRLPFVITNQINPEYIGTLSVTGGETYPLRVTLTQQSNSWLSLVEYDFHKLDGTMTPCEHSNANDAICHGAHGTVAQTADNAVVSNSNGVIIFTHNTETDQYGYTFTGTLSIPSLIWSGTWTKVATANSSYTASGTFSVKVVQIHDVASNPIYGKPFSMTSTEITFAQYDTYANATGAPKPDDEGWGRGIRPVINVSFNDAVAYAAWLSKKTGKKYRLPTEEEWEFAARAGTTTTYSWGNAVGVNRCSGCAGSEWQNKQTAPVRSYNPNGFGLHDMEGNVWELTQSGFDQALNSRSVRGGSFEMNWSGQTIADRLPVATTARLNSLGFRLVQDSDSIFEPLPTVTPEFVPISGKTFSISKYETSHAEYFAYTKETGAENKYGAGLGGGITQADVSWNNATAYAAWLSQKTGKTYRLPTEEEWAFAAANGVGLAGMQSNGQFEWVSSCLNDLCATPDAQGAMLNKDDPYNINAFRLVLDN